MHGDYQLAYCPINQIISLAFRDEAFLNTALTPELIWRLQVPKRSHSLSLRWKPEKLDTPLLRRLDRTPYGYELHKSLPMTYDSSRQALQELGRDARFEDDIGHYNYRRWTANEVNRTFPLDAIWWRLYLHWGQISSHTIPNCYSQGPLPARSGKGCSASLVTRFLKSTTNHNLSTVIFSMWSCSDRLRKVSCGLLEACSGRGIP